MRSPYILWIARRFLQLFAVASVAACGGLQGPATDSPVGTQSSSNGSGTTTGAGGTTGSGTTTGSGATTGTGGTTGSVAAGTTYQEAVLNVTLNLSTALGTTTLAATVLDGSTPVITDLWLYTLDANNKATPMNDFNTAASRPSPRLMLPATIAGQPSGLAPADDGRANGLMTANSRGVLQNGNFVSTNTGTVLVTLPAPPTTPILVVAGVEDERYTGAAAINPNGSVAPVPAGVGIPQTYARVTFAYVQPILEQECGVCHNVGGPLNANLYLVAGARNDLVYNNYALARGTQTCNAANPNDPNAAAACIAAITAAQFLVEPGAPAISDLLLRARPDENAGTSAVGLMWYGSQGARYNATYGDRRMPSTTLSPNAVDWTNGGTYFDADPAEYQLLYDWVAQGALP